jgi:hypothetical protein
VSRPLVSQGCFLEHCRRRGRGEVLGMDIGISEAETSWSEFLRKLKR